MFQDIWSNNHLFEGLSIIIGGDFDQILPVICKYIRATIVKACI